MAGKSKAPKWKSKLPVGSIRHKDKRVNIPTRELRDFLAEDEAKPKVLRYPRRTELDPQLVWRGKDEQDAADLAVPVVPVYIQEKIHPHAIVEDIRASARREVDTGPSLFADFNGIDEFEKKLDFYHHPQHWSNRMILGDSLLAMTSLAEKERLKGRVQCIYIDPPYGIKFGSNWQVSTRKHDVKDGRSQDATRQPEQIRAFRDTWELGIHSYLAYMRDRFVVARELLADTASVFVQIGDENVHLVRCALDEVFGSDNFIAMINYRTSVGLGATYIDRVADHILWFARDRERVKYHPLFTILRRGEKGATRYKYLQLLDGSYRSVTDEEDADPATVPAGARYFTDQGLTSRRAGSDDERYTYVYRGQDYRPPVATWRTTIDGMRRLDVAGRLFTTKSQLRFKKFFTDFGAMGLTNFWDDVGGGIQSRSDPKVYVVQTATSIVERCLLMTTDPGDLVLDPTCGSGTTAYVAEQWGRRWITIDTSRVALALARTRLMSGRFPYYLLADSPEGVQKLVEVGERGFDLTGDRISDQPLEQDIRKGFVYERVPHVTLKSIANNPDIKEGMSRAEIDAAIARHADSETLFDKPYDDPKRVRVAGPFTVESLSPHRILSTDVDLPQAEVEGRRDSAGGQFETMIIDNLRKAGVQNTRKSERLIFQRLDSYAGEWIQAAGEYVHADGKTRRVAVSIGPEHGTVGPDQVKEAAKEAVKGVGFDVLVVCGFAFDPHVSEEAKRFGKLTVLITRMNPDLAMGDELLKKTGAANLFMVFGEPDVDIRKQKDGNLIVEIKGLDVYDPTTGQIRNSSTDDIACWFIDTNYNGESFFVRHAYFTGADEPYEKLKRALRAEIDESAWSALYSTKSRPFPRPTTGKIAVKVINHYGDEVLKVFKEP